MLEGYFAGVQERVLSRSWNMEGIVLALVLVTVGLYLGGSYANKSKFESWIREQSKNLESQFFQVGVSKKELFFSDDEQHYVSYASGRVNVAQFIMKFTLESRQNFTVWLMEHVFHFFFESIEALNDEVEITATLHDDIKVDPFICAIVNKDDMDKKRKDNYFLSLTKTSDSDKLPVEYVYMSESAEINDALWTPELKELLEQNVDLIQYIAFTDQSSVHPFSLDETKPKFKAYLKLKLKSDKSSLARTSEIINRFLELIDFIASKKFKIRSEVSKKIAKVREAEVKKLQKLIDQDKKEQLEEQKLEEMKKQREKLKNNPKELEKLEKKQREKQQRKMMKKQRVRG
ncbi:hypothetical protein DASC09_045670 [Saccharomycopsis crataegensis]|uniref:DUF1682-domain-containing protein n=1 Tax=Saccharomycopsis crataegensis TaxID=43959 RepID=A0AAV5QQU6_9ASCO|nr:hypothetical protein DASC09_045670 [Saccharomycopsis crataegensis]